MATFPFVISWTSTYHIDIGNKRESLKQEDAAGQYVYRFCIKDHRPFAESFLSTKIRFYAEKLHIMTCLLPKIKRIL